MLEFFKKLKSEQKKEKKAHVSLTENVQSVLLLPLISGQKLNFLTVLSGKEDCYWSEVVNQKKAFLFNSFEELDDYTKTDEWQEKYSSKTRAAVFFLGYSKDNILHLFDKGEFSKLVVKASHSNELNLENGEVYQNNLFTPNLVATVSLVS